MTQAQLMPMSQLLTLYYSYIRCYAPAANRREHKAMMLSAYV